MSPISICLIIIAALTVLLTISICINILIIRGKRQKAISEHNQIIVERDKELKILKEKEEEYNEKIKKASSIDDFISIRNDILSNFKN